MSQTAKFSLLIVLAILSANWAYAAAEKGPRCSDGIDNDGDGLIDSNDPDCSGDGINILSTLVFKDANGVVIGPADVSHPGANQYVFVSGVGRPARIRIDKYLFVPLDGELYWELPGCTGSSYMAATETLFFEDIRRIRLPNTSDSILIVSDPSQANVVQYSSHSDSSGNCSESISTRQVSPWVIVTLDYLPPFSLELL